MTSEDTKGAIELAVFEEFVSRTSLAFIPGSAEKRNPPEPDILCRLESGEYLAFELCEACAPEIAAADSQALREGVIFTWAKDVSIKTIENKLQKSYDTPWNIQLIPTLVPRAADEWRWASGETC